tara:strand:+ start:3482 stop:3943 length:462 start_codon:yes stop_codon:yes gene_type:complete
MAHFAKLDANNIVTQVIVVGNDDIKDGNGDESEAVGITFCKNLFGNDTNWKQTSYNAQLSRGFRGNFAGIGMTYMTNVQTLGVASTDIFIEQQSEQPASWGIGKTTAKWISPLPEPELTSDHMAANKYWHWDEAGHQADSSTPKTVGWALSSY